ncbi:spermidine/putrescine ABC transporter substrate-binding protein [Vibrio hangzhouensis]|uniref:polyamine ABC transporter substrate-binding protein n=1 Tax=Vibrio hangzhouensis TaxID=462991 RepID=UPI001C93C37C|nr:spermidine/putrescine ABC transporter substrate-binding protein [Vibrio hangzhouensis]MBY6196493.1 spermidine/putrescine ABC transporter substrate-binding protein [Vibrio hangzhouensis]
MGSQAEEILFYNWVRYLDQTLIEQFEAEYGVKIAQDHFSSEDLRDEVINSGRVNGFDLVLVDGWSLQMMGNKKLFHNVSELLSLMPGHFGAEFQQACGEYGIPYSWGTLGIVYRSEITSEPITSWKQLFNPPKEHHGKVVMYINIVDGTASALLAAEQAPFTSDVEALKQAYAYYQLQAPYVLSYEYGDSYAYRYGQGSEMTMALGYSGDEYSIAESTGQKDWVYVVPKEGTVIWTECLAFPAASEIKPETLDFVRFLSRPDIAIQNAESVWMATPVIKALDLATEEYRTDPGLFPSQDVLEKSHYYQPIAASGQRLRFKIQQSLR